jgi:hypothetical protein
MTDVLEAIFRTVGWGILIFVVVVIIWLSPIGKFIDEWEEFRNWKRERRK